MARWPGGPVKRWLDKELPAIRNARADLIGETVGGEFVHLEFMSVNQKFIELRMAYVEIYQTCGRHPFRRWCTWGARSCGWVAIFQKPFHELPVPGGGLS